MARTFDGARKLLELPTQVVAPFEISFGVLPVRVQAADVAGDRTGAVGQSRRAHFVNPLHRTNPCTKSP